MDLKSEIEAFIAASGAESVALAYCDIQSGREILIHADEPFHAASTMKICVMMELFRQAESGRLKLSDEIAIRNEFKSIVDGSAYRIDPEDDSEKTLYTKLGESMSLIGLCEPMITHSSNLATNLLVERLGAENITSFMHEMGATGLIVMRGVEDGKAYQLGLNNVATARGLMTILVQLARKTVVSTTASTQMIASLLRQTHRNCLPAKLPIDALVANKTGWNIGICHDAGIIQDPDGRTYVLAVLTRGLDETSAGPNLIASISALVYGKTAL